MFIVKAPDNQSIRTHVCCSYETALMVSDYIMGKYSCDMSIKEVEGLPYYDVGGMISVSKGMYNIALKHIECSIHDAGILSVIISHKIDYSKKGFNRIPSFYGNICLSNKELVEVKEFIKNNKELLDKADEDADKAYGIS